MEFAYGLLVDEAEAPREGLTEAWQVAEWFGVPEAMVRIQGRLLQRRARRIMPDKKQPPKPTTEPDQPKPAEGEYIQKDDRRRKKK